MKAILILMFLIMFSPFAHATEIVCETERQYMGVWGRECPMGAVVVGVDVRPSGNFIWTYVKCEKHITVCKEKSEKKVDSDLKLD